MKNFKFLPTFLLLALVFSIAVSPARFISSALNGLSAFAVNVLPCTLPFMILTRLIIEQGQMQGFCRCFKKPFQKLYGTSQEASYVFLMSIMAGYPVGSKMTADLYEAGKISKTDAFRMSAFCSNSGPMFIIGTVGTLLLNSPKVGGILFASHVLSALLNGLLYRKIKAKDSEKLPQNSIATTPASFGEVVTSSVSAALNVGAIICLFFIIIDVLSPIFNLLPSSLVPLAEGMVELTRGCIDSSTLQTNLAAIICSFLISFGGFSTIMQSNAMLKKLKMPVWLFSVQKFLQGLISAGLTAIMLLL